MVKFNIGYGMMEMCGIIIVIVVEFFVDWLDSVGFLMFIFDVMCVDSDGNEVLCG